MLYSAISLYTVSQRVLQVDVKSPEAEVRIRTYACHCVRNILECLECGSSSYL